MNVQHTSLLVLLCSAILAVGVVLFSMAGWGTGNVEVQITWPPHSRTPALESLASDGASESTEEGLMSGYASWWPWGRLDSNTSIGTKILGLGAEQRQKRKNE